MLKLLKNFGGSCEIQNRRGDLPIHEAIQAGAKDCVEYLLSSHPSSINVSNHDGRTGLHLAAASGNLEMVVLLCSRNAEINPLMLYKDTLLTPLDLAIQKNHELIVEYLRLRQDGKLAEELSEEMRKEIRSQLKYQILAVREDKQKDDIVPNTTRILNQSGKLPVGENKNTVKMESVSQETQTTMQIYRAAATNTSRPESRDSINVARIYQSTLPIQQFIAKATSTADLEQNLPVKQLQLQGEKIQKISGNAKKRDDNGDWPNNNNWTSEEDDFEDENKKKGEKIQKISGNAKKRDDNGDWPNNNNWTSEEDDFEDENKKKGKSSRKNLNKSRDGYGLQLKQLKENEYLYEKNEKGGKMKKKLVEMTRIDENLSNDNDNNDNNDNGKEERSTAAMNYHHKHRSQEISKDAHHHDFETKLMKSVGSHQVDIYQTEFGEITMQQRFNKNKRIGRCYAYEEAIFNELTHLKKMQLQYGKVKEQILVRSLINNFCKMYNLNPSQFKFNTFHGWEKFLCDQLKLLYLEERNRIFTSHHSRYSATNKYKTGIQRKQPYYNSTVLGTITECTRSAHSDSSQTLCSGEKRCNCLYNKRDLL
ncbi:ankyrin repeat domain-containing protein [Loa loa]|uniref:Ankyrin repeat domain-containing protein n=1 Tax=Loa loa TaxID=7209 RepID=A0A1S0UER8_LOALO|nr:ankyrin repeat domain-containing protein [Loa loa]EJD73916.1 ankyrin repeat domain-containing protein [Loa loa]